MDASLQPQDILQLPLDKNTWFHLWTCEKNLASTKLQWFFSVWAPPMAVSKLRLASRAWRCTCSTCWSAASRCWSKRTSSCRKTGRHFAANYRLDEEKTSKNGFVELMMLIFGCFVEIVLKSNCWVPMLLLVEMVKEKSPPGLFELICSHLRLQVKFWETEILGQTMISFAEPFGEPKNRPTWKWIATATHLPASRNLTSHCCLSCCCSACRCCCWSASEVLSCCSCSCFWASQCSRRAVSWTKTALLFLIRCSQCDKMGSNSSDSCVVTALHL